MIRFLPPANELSKNKDCDDEGEEVTEEVLFSTNFSFEYISLHESYNMRSFQAQNLNLVVSEEYGLDTKLAMSQLSEKEISFELIEVVLLRN